MLEAKYFKDYKHNYMILQCGQEAAVRSYQYKILTSDKIKEILRCSVRHINGVTYYYYDISSRTTLKSLYQSTKMSGEQVKDLLWQLHGICDKLAGFFMEEAGLVLLPEHIYYDFSSRKYIGLYYPDYQVSGAEAYEPLMNFLLEHIDTEDRQLTENMYRIYEMAGEAHFLIEDALQVLEESNEIGQEAVPDKMDVFDIMDDLPPVEPLKEEDPRPRRSFFYPLFAVLSVLGIAGSVAVYNMYDLVQEEEIALYGIMAVMGACFLFGLWGIFRANKTEQSARAGSKPEESAIPDEMADRPYVHVSDREDEAPYKSPGRRLKGTEESGPGRRLKGTEESGSGRRLKGAEESGPGRRLKGIEESAPGRRLKGIEENGPGRRLKGAEENGPDRRIYGETGGETAEENIALGNVISRDMNLDPMPPRNAPAWTASSHTVSSSQDQGMDYYGNTVFFDGSTVAEYKLYAVDRRNKQHIELKKFPCTVGKMAGCVDYVLADNSVSRIHARFERQGDRVLLTDMNSTNGTYKNGLRMQPQETVEIEPGDEIRFGNLNYCYR